MIKIYVRLTLKHSMVIMMMNSKFFKHLMITLMTFTSYFINTPYGKASFETPPRTKSQFEIYESDIRRYFDHLYLPEKEVMINDDAGALDKPQNFAALIKHHEGLVIGEIHSEVIAKKSLIEVMPLLKNKAILYLEHVFFDTHQTLLDAFLKDPQAELDGELKDHLKRLDRGHMDWFRESDKKYKELWSQYNFTQLILAAKKSGIEVKAIDHSQFYQNEDYKRGRRRYQSLNYFAQVQYNLRSLSIDLENDWSFANGAQQETEEKLPIFFVGNAHIESFKGVAGIADLLSMASIAFYEWDKDLPEAGSYRNFTDPRSSVYSDYSLIKPFPHKDS